MAFPSVKKVNEVNVLDFSSYRNIREKTTIDLSGLFYKFIQVWYNWRFLPHGFRDNNYRKLRLHQTFSKYFINFSKEKSKVRSLRVVNFCISLIYMTFKLTLLFNRIKCSKVTDRHEDCKLLLISLDWFICCPYCLFSVCFKLLETA